MTETVKLTQLYKVNSKELIMATCHVIDTEDDDRFECFIDGDKDFKEQLWQYCNGNWQVLDCVIKFDEVTPNGTPIEAIIISIKGFTVIHL